MSKSKGEFLTVSLLEEKGYDPMVYRFFCLGSHYRKTLVFDWGNLDNAKAAYEKLITKIASIVKNTKGDIDKAKFGELRNAFDSALGNDLNTALGITVLYDVLKADTSDATKLAVIDEIDSVLTLGLISHAKALNEAAEKAEADIPEEIMSLVEERKAARKAKDFAKADELRDKITSLGWTIEETRQGTKVYKK